VVSTKRSSSSSRQDNVIVMCAAAEGCKEESAEKMGGRSLTFRIWWIVDLIFSRDSGRVEECVGTRVQGGQGREFLVG
jgi:hypothetical protein